MNKLSKLALLFLAIGAREGLAQAPAGAGAGRQALPPKPPIVDPSRAQLLAWITKVQGQPRSLYSPNPDPDYSEFWVETRPKEPPPPPPSEPEERRFRAVGLKPVLASTFRPVVKLELDQIEGLTNRTVGAVDLRAYLARKKPFFNGQGTAWSEEVWTEITPDFAEMDPEPKDELRRRAGGLRGAVVVNVSARRDGKPVPPDYYSAILRALDSNADSAQLKGLKRPNP